MRLLISRTKIRKVLLQRQGLDTFVSSHMERNTTQRKSTQVQSVRIIIHTLHNLALPDKVQATQKKKKRILNKQIIPTRSMPQNAIFGENHPGPGVEYPVQQECFNMLSGHS